MDWPTLDLSYEQSHRTRGLLRLTSFPKRHAFKAHPWCSEHLYFLPLCGWTMHHRQGGPCGHPSIRVCSAVHPACATWSPAHPACATWSPVHPACALFPPPAAGSGAAAARHGVRSFRRGRRSVAAGSRGCRVAWLPVAWLSGLMAAGARGCLSCGCRSRGLVLPGAVGCAPTGPQFAFAPDERHGSGLSASSPALWSAEAVFRNMRRSDCLQLLASGGSGLCHSERPRGVGECVHSLLDGLLPQGPRSVGRRLTLPHG